MEHKYFTSDWRTEEYQKETFWGKWGSIYWPLKWVWVKIRAWRRRRRRERERERECEGWGRGGGRSPAMRLFSITWHQNGNGGLLVSSPGRLLSEYTNTETFNVKVSVQLSVTDSSTLCSAPMNAINVWILLDVCGPKTHLYQSNIWKKKRLTNY